MLQLGEVMQRVMHSARELRMKVVGLVKVVDGEIAKEGHRNVC